MPWSPSEPTVMLLFLKAGSPARELAQLQCAVSYFPLSRPASGGYDACPTVSSCPTSLAL